VTRNAFYETPPFSRIVKVAWVDEAWSVSWTYPIDSSSDVVPATAGCFPPLAPFPPHSSIVLSAVTHWGFKPPLVITSPGLVVSGTPDLPSGSTEDTFGVAIMGSASVIGTSLTFHLKGQSAIGPVQCWGSGTGGPSDPLMSLFGKPLASTDNIDEGTVTAAGITGTIDGVPAVKTFTQISYSVNGVGVFVAFDTAPP
jgi:hypothetical protein